MFTFTTRISRFNDAFFLPFYFRLTKPATFADCVGDELPCGWELAFHPQIGIYFVDHNRRRNQLEDPRLEWRNLQINMLNNYLQTATSVENLRKSTPSLASLSSNNQVNNGSNSSTNQLNNFSNSNQRLNGNGSHQSQLNLTANGIGNGIYSNSSNLSIESVPNQPSSTYLSHERINLSHEQLRRISSNGSTSGKTTVQINGNHDSDQSVNHYANSSELMKSHYARKGIPFI